MTQRSSSGDQFSNQSQGSNFDTVDLGASGQSGTSGGQRAVDQARDAASQVAEQARETTGQLKEQAKEQATSQLSSQKDRAAEGLGSVARALRQTGRQLGDQDQGAVQDYVTRAASQVERLSGYLENNDLNGLMDDVERFARRQPALFLGGAFALGLLGARFLKSSRPQRSSGRDYRYGGMEYSRTRMYDTGRGYGGETRYGGYGTTGMTGGSYGGATGGYSDSTSGYGTTAGYTSTTSGYTGATTGGMTADSTLGVGASDVSDTTTSSGQQTGTRSTGGTEGL